MSSIDTLHDVPFASRHLGPSAGDRATMLDRLGFSTLDALIDAAVPPSIRSKEKIRLPEPVTEAEVLAELDELAARNRITIPMIGLGYHPAITPAVVRRNVLENPAWYTAYTPYQPEISQGRLEALLNFQTMVADLAGLTTANASLLDEGTAIAEAMMLMHRAGRSSSSRLVLDEDTHPQSIAVVHTRAEALGIDVVLADLNEPLPEEGFFGVVASYPGSTGQIRDLRGVAESAKRAGAMITVTADPLALTLLESPGALGADVVVGSTQRFGVPLFYGGPHAAYMAVRAGLERHLPGRLVGVSVDSTGRAAYRLTLQTREQHIRRDRATSNICTAQVLLAVVASFYGVYHGPEGLRAIATRVHLHAADLARKLAAKGCAVVHGKFFDTVLVDVPGQAARILAAASDAGIGVRQVDGDRVAISTSEVTTAADIDTLVRLFPGSHAAGDLSFEDALPSQLLRATSFMDHPVFHEHRSETALLRYIRKLSDRDFALDRGMIPLGSCTMKLNAAAEMEPISFPGFADLHPFAPAEDAAGYTVLIEQLEQWLAEITGYARVSFQPNAGSQGELAGLLAIRAYHRDHGETERDVCLIPASAHGTNAASAVLAGMRVVVVASHEDGSVDLDDLEAKCREHATSLAAAMVTYPSTHGVYEEGISRVCELIHAHGGQVYVDGANLNALLGIARPGDFGGDVSHLNLHKTFCIPHGGGGPGVGPVAVAAHLASYLPTHAQHPNTDLRDGIGPVSAAPHGSAGILPIPWAYVRMMGADGLTLATKTAVLSANYIAQELGEDFPVLFSGSNGLVAHECILDLRPLTAQSGVTVDDVAKRLVDHGFHAPTVSFPVSGTIMIEPTESEPLFEIDRFIAAMQAIRSEIDQVSAGAWPIHESPLRHAPHTAAVVVDDDWDRSYERRVGAYPSGPDPDKYWPPVGRVDQAYGDRNLLCSCPPPEAFADENGISPKGETL